MRGIAVLAMLPALGGLYALTGPVAARADASDPTSGLRIVFSAFERSDTSDHGVYVVEPGSDEPRRVSPDDGATYSWPQWAMNGNKIVYTRRAGPPGAPENIFLADTDGSHRIQLTHATWRVDQPKVSPDGRTLLFAAFWPQSPQVAIYTADLETLEVTNLSAVASTEPSFDSDPKWTSDGRIVFSHSLDDTGATRPTAIWTMNADGTDRQPLAQDQFFNVDAEISPDGRMLAYGSYRGEGRPATVANSIDPLQVKAAPWMLVVVDRATGAKRVLTAGRECADVLNPCRPEDASAAVPNWTPDGSTVGYISLLSPNKVCICAVGRDGADPRVVVESATLAINWFNWTAQGARPPSAVPDDRIGARRSDARLLFGGPSWFGLPPLAESRNDRWEDIGLRLPSGLEPTAARWSRDRSKVVFSARVPYDPARFEPGPPPPAGAQRHVHFTLEQLSPVFVPPEDPLPGLAEEQVFLLDRTTNRVRQLTTPWTEDYMDAMRDGDARANRDPDISPDGRYVTATNISALNGESFIIRIDLQTGAVFNLTNATAGAVPVADGGARYSPDGRHVVFWTLFGETPQLALMQADDGRGFRFLTDDASSNIAPSWSPDGRSVVFARYPAAAERADGPAGRDGSIVTVDIETGVERVVATGMRSGASNPVFSPDGGRIGFISISEPGQSDIYVVPATGGTARPLQVSFLTNELFLDWR
jgi:Tol biopolymer transport system component